MIDRTSMSAGLRYLVEHGHAADGSHAENDRPTQHLVNPPAHNPTSSASVHEWVRRRAQHDAQMQAAHQQAEKGSE